MVIIGGILGNIFFEAREMFIGVISFVITL